MAELSTSAFAADFFHMERDIRYLESYGVDSLHIDVMDGHFVPLFGFNDIQLRQIEKICTLKKSVHIMAFHPGEIIKRFIMNSVDQITLHVESDSELNISQMLETIRSQGKKAGLAISPHTSIQALVPYLEHADDILVLSAPPGTEHSKFSHLTYERLKQVSQLAEGRKHRISLSVDGGLDIEKAKKCIEAGADIVVLGKAFYSSADKKKLVGQIHRE